MKITESNKDAMLKQIERFEKEYIENEKQIARLSKTKQTFVYLFLL
jgi:uncharacterized protein (UPF0305 family)